MKSYRDRIADNFSCKMSELIPDNIYGWIEKSRDGGSSFTFLKYSCDLMDEHTILTKIKSILRCIKNRDILEIDGYMLRDAHQCSMKVNITKGVFVHDEIGNKMYESSNTQVKIIIACDTKKPTLMVKKRVVFLD